MVNGVVIILYSIIQNSLRRTWPTEDNTLDTQSRYFLCYSGKRIAHQIGREHQYDDK